MPHGGMVRLRLPMSTVDNWWGGVQRGCMTDPHDFGSSLRRERRLAGLSVRELASRLGVTTQAVYHWEAGRSLPRLDTLRRLAEALGLDVLGGAGR